MMRFQLSLITLSLVIAGCATQLTTNGQGVREIQKEWKNSCEYIGSSQTSSAFKFGAKGNHDTVLNNMRNITAENGGNAYLVNSFYDDGLGHFTSTFEMHNCPESLNRLSNKYDSLERIKDLLGKGVITQEEYEIEKKQILNP